MTEEFPRSYLFDLTSQLRRAALSVPTNLVEGCAAAHTNELLQFINIARRSLRETQYLLMFSLRRHLIPSTRYEPLTTGYEEVHRMVNGLSRSLKRSKTKGG
jgi:four helix bundle protein